MSRKVKKTRDARPSATGERFQFAGLRPLLPVACVVTALILATGGMEYLKSRVLAAPEYNPPVKINLQYLKGSEWVEREGWLPRITTAIQVPTGRKLMDASLLTAVAERASATGWVRSVERVARGTDGSINLLCEYRRPIAMVLTDRGKYIPIDREGVRLPEEYDVQSVDANSGWMRILGVHSEAPAVGKAYGNSGRGKDEDALAAVQLAALLFDQEEIAPKISGIDVTNFNGREDKFKTHIRLWTRDGRVIRWGSAIGREVEEPQVTDKLRNIALWLKRSSPQAYVDVSVYRNGVLAPLGR